jgi:hypothetical protein
MIGQVLVGISDVQAEEADLSTRWSRRTQRGRRAASIQGSLGCAPTFRRSR